jgi:hypothetical protein
LDHELRHDAVTGTAAMARHDEGTNVTVSLAGLPAMTKFTAHVHEGTCAEAGAHYRFDPSGPDMPPNEIHLVFTSTLNGTARVTVHNDAVAGPDAKSVVVHSTAALSPEIACTDLT